MALLHDPPDFEDDLISIARDELAFLALKARDAQDGVVVSGGSNASDDGVVSALEGRRGNATAAELRGAIEALSEDAQAELVALVWMGRGDFDAEDWEEAKALARERRIGPTSDYLLGMPLFGDYLEEGAAALGVDLAGDESLSLYHPIRTRDGAAR